jgi:hypothetical protein
MTAGFADPFSGLPIGVVFEGEEPLDRLGAAGAGLKQSFQGLTDLVQATVGMLARTPRRTVEPVEGRGQLEDPAPRFEKVAVQNLDRGSHVRHGGIAPLRLVTRWHPILDVIFPDSIPARKLSFFTALGHRQQLGSMLLTGYNE